jgi:hypothetical protein
MTDYRQKLSALFARPLWRPIGLAEALGDRLDDEGVGRERRDGKTYQFIEPDDAHIKIPLPSLGQQTDYTCGPGALRPIFKYFGVGPDPDEEATYEHGMDSDPEKGTPPPELVDFARGWGYQTIAYEHMTIDEILAFLDQGKPVVCAIQAWGTPRNYRKRRNGHFVTAIGYDDERQRLIVHDPAIKRNRGYRIYADFDKHWYNEEPDGTNYDHWGAAIWRDDNASEMPVAVSPLKKAYEIK